jgi:ribosome-binding factor A
MPDRQVRITELIKELAATYIQHEANTDPLITVTSVYVSPDTRQAIIFITTIPDVREADALIFLKRNATELRNYMKRTARMKNIPHIEFMIDAGERHRQHMDELVRDIKKRNNKP